MQLFRLGFLSSVAALFCVSTASQAAVTCRGPVTRVVVQWQTGNVEADWGWGQTRLCNISSNVTIAGATITTQVCQVLLSQALTAFGTGEDMAAYFTNLTDCANMKTGLDFAEAPVRVFVIK